MAAVDASFQLLFLLSRLISGIQLSGTSYFLRKLKPRKPELCFTQQILFCTICGLPETTSEGGGQGQGTLTLLLGEALCSRGCAFLPNQTCVFFYFHLVFFLSFLIWLSRRLVFKQSGARVPLQSAAGAPCGVGLSNCSWRGAIFCLVSTFQLIEHQLILISLGWADPSLPVLLVV